MNTKAEKISLLSEMIAFSIIDGDLHKKEYLFLSMIAGELGFDKAEFDDLFHQELHTIINKSEFERIQQFYRLALLMHCDGVLHDREQIKIREIGVLMGLNPFAIKRILELMANTPNAIIDSEIVLRIFQEQLN
ncbi:excinuclease ABC subunit B [Flavobacterium sp.]|uniref:excinuclease ABC subunit B n=1 Tax=Flavobacterium sp. TaxID=239 RepID=UPI00286ABD13|nr:excinuclease ABC subunit B [Flavobacterium sp.]